MFPYYHQDQAVQVEIEDDHVIVKPLNMNGESIQGLRLRVAIAWDKLRKDPSVYMPSVNWAERELAARLGATPPEVEPDTGDENTIY